MTNWLLAGLGNPGSKYTYTRHNWGFLLLEHIRKKEGAPSWNTEKQGPALVCSFKISGTQEPTTLYLMEPQTYMNLSGDAVVPFLRFFKIPATQLIVAQDDLDMQPMSAKIKLGGRSAGHRGIQHIIERLGSEEFLRIKGGIGKPQDQRPIERYVLEAFSEEEMAFWNLKFDLIWEGIRSHITGNAVKAQNTINSIKLNKE